MIVCVCWKLYCLWSVVKGRALIMVIVIYCKTERRTIGTQINKTCGRINNVPFIIFVSSHPIMTIETDIIQPVKDFVRDSKFLINRCTKPDKKGRSFLSPLSCRVHSNCYCNRYWLCRYGTCRLFC